MAGISRGKRSRAAGWAEAPTVETCDKKKQAASGDWQPVSGIGQNVAAEATGQALTATATAGEGRQRHATEQQAAAGFWHGGKVAKFRDVAIKNSLI